MSTKQRNLFRQPALLIDWDDCESSTTAGFPIDRNVFWVRLAVSVSSTPPYDEASNLHQVRIPSIATDSNVVVGCLFLRWLSEDMSYSQGLAGAQLYAV